MSARHVTAQRLRELLHYEPETGVFTWRVSRGPNKAGDVAGGVTGARCISISIHFGGAKRYAHRLAWLYMTGEFPPKGMQVDHRDLNPLNNAWANLRLATPSQNACNRRKQCNNTTGFKGVFPAAGKYIAQIVVNRKQHYLGLFSSPKLAHLRYRLAARRLHGEFARAG